MSILRILLSLIAILIGVAFVGEGTYGWLMTDTMASHATAGFDATDWRIHWMLWSEAAIAIGLMTGAGGVAAVRRRFWGFLLIALAATVCGLFPWLLHALHWTSYAFEVPRRSETTLCFLVAISMIAIYAITVHANRKS